MRLLSQPTLQLHSFYMSQTFIVIDPKSSWSAGVSGTRAVGLFQKASFFCEGAVIPFWWWRLSPTVWVMIISVWSYRWPSSTWCFNTSELPLARKGRSPHKILVFFVWQCLYCLFIPEGWASFLPALERYCSFLFCPHSFWWDIYHHSGSF